MDTDATSNWAEELRHRIDNPLDPRSVTRKVWLAEVVRLRGDLRRLAAAADDVLYELEGDTEAQLMLRREVRRVME